MHKFFAKTLFLGKKVYSLPECHSTNIEASQLVAEKGEGEGTIVVTEYQLSGKGQRGNSWESEKGKNIILSIILRPRFISPNDQFFLHTVCSLAIYDTLFPYLGSKLKIKWPNDIYYVDQKICGILIENSIRGHQIDSSIVGIGLNVNQENYINPNAISLREITLEEFNRSELLEALLINFEKRYLQLKSGKSNDLKSEYLTKLYRFNEKHLFSAYQEIFLGTITGINEQGKILIEDTSGVKAYDFKEVAFLKK